MLGPPRSSSQNQMLKTSTLVAHSTMPATTSGWPAALPPCNRKWVSRISDTEVVKLTRARSPITNARRRGDWSRWRVGVLDPVDNALAGVLGSLDRVPGPIAQAGARRVPVPPEPVSLSHGPAMLRDAPFRILCVVLGPA